MHDTSTNQPNPNKRSVPFFSHLIATGLFSGYSPIAPGTAGSIVGMLFYMIPSFEYPIIISSLISIFFFIGVYVSSKMERSFGEDPQIVVIDEVVGMWISIAFLPKTILIAFLGFLLFRFYDIFKPPPCRKLESLKNGWGIMLDDVMAGIYANLTIQLILFSFLNL
ncbi:MAG: phosphatidylglycerophosphatase A [Ignavibacteriales bacterium]|nr:phosphatidylglycerophosphatase A [Ignavibacteriales bacterium]